MQVLQSSSMAAILGWCFALLALHIGTQSTGADELEPRIDVMANELLSRAVAPLQAAKALRVQIDTSIKVTQTGVEPTTTNSTYSLVIAKPDRVALRLRVGRGKQTFCDGRQLVEASNFHREYSIRTAPKSLSDYFAARDEPFVGPLHQVLIKSIFAMDVTRGMLEDVSELSLAETQQIAGQECRRVHFVSKHGEWDFWIDTSDEPAIRQLDFALDPEKTKGTVVSLSHRLTNWVFSPKISELEFAYTPPKDYRQVPPDGHPAL